MYFLALMFSIFSSLFANKALADLKDKASFEKLLSEKQIQQRIHEVGQKITQDYANIDEISVVIVMKGAIAVATDLIRVIDRPVTLNFIKATSFNGTQRGTLSILGLEECNVHEKHVLVIDDIFDSGNTLYTIVKKIEEQQPKSIRSVVACNKKTPRIIEYTPDYVLFDIEDKFVVGYGMDYEQYFRNLPDIYFVP